MSRRPRETRPANATEPAGEPIVEPEILFSETSHPIAAIDAQDVIEPMTFNIAAAIRQLWWPGLHPDFIYLPRLERAVKYIEREISRLRAVEARAVEETEGE